MSEPASSLIAASTRRSRLSQLCLAVWIVVGVWGAAQVARGLPAHLRAIRGDEVTQRATNWAGDYTFAYQCARYLSPQARIMWVDPTGWGSSDRAYGVGLDVDLGDAPGLVYMTYPRAIRPFGHLPADWMGQAAALHLDVVALWSQALYRLPQAHVAAQQAEAVLRQALPGRVLCTYDAPGGDHGVLFALPGARASALSAGAAPPLAAVTLATGARTALGLLSLWLIGAIVLCLVTGRDLLPSTALIVAVALPLGCLSVTVELLLFSLAGWRWSLLALCLPWIVLLAGALGRSRAAFPQRLLGQVIRLRTVRLTRDEGLALGLLIGLGLVVLAVAPLGLPWIDGFRISYLKAHLFFYDHSVAPFYAQVSGHAADPPAMLVASFPTYPPLVPLSVSWLYLVLGAENEHTTLLLWPLLLFALLGGFYGIVRGYGSRRLALWSTVALAFNGTALIEGALYGSYADLPLATLLLLGCGLLISAASTSAQRVAPWALAGLLLAAAGLTKQEGIPLGVVALVAAPLLLGRRSLPGWRGRLALGLSALVFVVGLGPWIVLRMLDTPLPDQTVYHWATSALLHNIAVAAVGVAARAAVRWIAAIVLIAAVALLILGERRQHTPLYRPEQRFWFLITVLLGGCAIDIAAIAVSPIEVHTELSVAATRLLLQITPLLFLAVAELWSLLRAVPSRSPLVTTS